jgi:hypothetical protein
LRYDLVHYVIAVLHAGLACGCLAVYFRAHPRKRSTLWLLLAFVQVFFSVDAVFGIRFALAAVGRAYFKHHGWYGKRRPFQAVVSLTAVTASIVLGRRMIRLASRNSIRIALAGAALLVVSFAVQAVSWHYSDKLLAWPHSPLSINAFIRLVGCGLTWLGIRRERDASF